MVRFLYIFILLLLPASAFAQVAPASFDAYIDRENVAVNETFQVKLELVGAQANSMPDLSVMPSDLQVTSQQQLSNVTYVNGAQSQDISWILDVVPQKEGTYKVPAIEVKTSMGSLYTKPFRIFVKSADQIASNTSDNSVYIEVQADKLDPYINEPIIYKTNIYYLGEISNTELVKPKSDNATVEQISEPKPSKQILNGVNYKMIEVSYLITPLHAGDVMIQPSVLRGKIAKNSAATPDNQQMDALFGNLSQGGVVNSITQYVPFTVASKPLKLTVKPAEAGVNPWLALYDLQIDEELGDVQTDAQTNRISVKAGEPFTRKIRMTAYGKGGEGLPDIENAFNSPDFKVYADRPEFSKELVAGDGAASTRLKGTKTQNFTFIPQKSGMLNLPELNINYWSLKDNKLATANLADKVITSLSSDKAAAVNNVNAAPTQAASTNQQQNAMQQTQRAQQQNSNADQAQDEVETAASLQDKIEQKFDAITNSPQGPNLIILVLSFVICVIMFVSFKVITTSRKSPVKLDDSLVNPKVSFDDLDRKLNRKITDPKPNRIINFSSNGRETSQVASFAKQVRDAKSYKELQEVLQRFATRYLGISQNAGTVNIAMALSQKYHVDKIDAMKYAAELDSVLYAGKQIDLEYLKNAFADLISKAEGKFGPAIDNDNESDRGSRLTSLNP